MQHIDIYIGTSLRGPQKGAGRVMYVMKAVLESGRTHESRPQIMELAEGTEARLTVRAIWEALQRINFPCEILIHTECSYVYSAVNSAWLGKWSQNGWKTERGGDLKDAEWWARIWDILNTDGHIITVERGKHEYSHWMAWNMLTTPALEGVFKEVKPEG